MTICMTITRQVHFRSAKHGRRVLKEGEVPSTPDPGVVPRISRLMALAIHMDDLVRRGEVADYAELARLAHVTRARLTQIMNLLHLAPDIQEAILDLPRAEGSRGAITERMVRPIAANPDWRRQRVMWNDQLCKAGRGTYKNHGLRNLYRFNTIENNSSRRLAPDQSNVLNCTCLQDEAPRRSTAVEIS